MQSRWTLAQKSERQWWEKSIAGMEFAYFRSFAQEVLSSFQGIITLQEDTRILEIGTGPAGILTHLPSRYRFGIDPLEQFYSRMEKCRQVRDREVHYTSAQAEHIPFPDNSFDVLIIDNILDHCEDINAVFSEMKRVLAPGGIVYLRNFTLTWWGIALADALEFFKIDQGHPFHFNKGSLNTLFEKFGMEQISLKNRGFFRHNAHLLLSGKLSHILRALSLSQADKVRYILRNAK